MASAERTFVVFLGRTNHLNPSALVSSLVRDVEAAGHIVRPFRGTSQWINEELSRSRLAGFCHETPRWGPLVKNAVKLGILLRRPSRWGYLLEHLTGPATLPRCDRRRLRAMIRNANADSVCLFAHSAGGLLATTAASNPSVTRLVCFGYPFRHPERGDESYRTAQLPSVTKPFLIIQGDWDPYGNGDDAQRYPLSPSTTVFGVGTGHDYGELDPIAYRKCRDFLLEFVGGRSG